MSKKMRAKLVVQNVQRINEAQENLSFTAVSGKYGEKGESEDNTYARYTPQASLSMSITNPVLIGQFKPGDKFYVDFTPADE